MKPIRIFRHINCEGPGYFTTVLEKNNIPYELVCIDEGDSLPSTVDDVSALVFMGGSMSVNDDLTWLHQEFSLIQKAIETDLPMLGHCLGGQLISKALGGTIRSNPVKEIGWLPIQKIQNKQTDDWLGAVTDNSLAFHWHGETFSIPKGGTAILKSQHCAHQGFVIGNTLALQCHVEMTTDMVHEWANLYKDELSEPSETVQSPEIITADLENKIQQLQTTADALYRRWLQPILK